MRIALKKESGEILESDFKSSQVSIGRSPKSDFVIADESLSRQHCLIELVDGDFFVTDLGSSNGVFIDGNKIAPNQRTLYKSFNALSIGTFDCTLQDVSDTPETITYREPKATEASTAQTKSRPLRKKREETKNQKIQLLLIPLAILGFAVFYYANSDQEYEETVIETKTTEDKPTYKSKVDLLKEMPNQAKAFTDYADQEKLKSCQGDFEKDCQKMKLNSSQEGFFRESNNLSLYLEPILYEKDLRYRGIEKLSDKLDLIVMDKVLGSDPMTEMFLKNSIHLHVIFKEADGKVRKIFRFHPSQYSSAVASRLDALRLLEETLQTSQSQKFWAHLNKHISVIEAPTP